MGSTRNPVIQACGSKARQASTSLDKFKQVGGTRNPGKYKNTTRKLEISSYKKNAPKSVHNEEVRGCENHEVSETDQVSKDEHLRNLCVCLLFILGFLTCFLRAYQMLVCLCFQHIDCFRFAYMIIM